MNITQELVPFNNDNIIAIRKEGKLYVAVRRICENLGLDAHWQIRELNEDEVLKDALISETVIYESLRVQESIVCFDTQCSDNTTGAMTFLDHEYLQGWLFRIKANRCKEEARGKLLAYQKLCYKVLHDYFTGKAQNLDESKNSEESLQSLYHHAWRKFRILEIEAEIENLPNYSRLKHELILLKAQNKFLKVNPQFEPSVRVDLSKGLMTQPSALGLAILEKLAPCHFDHPERVLFTASEIFKMFPQAGNMTALGMELRRQGFAKKMVKISNKIYQKYAVLVK